MNNNFNINNQPLISIQDDLNHLNSTITQLQTDLSKTWGFSYKKTPPTMAELSTITKTAHAIFDKIHSLNFLPGTLTSSTLEKLENQTHTIQKGVNTLIESYQQSYRRNNVITQLYQAELLADITHFRQSFDQSIEQIHFLNKINTTTHAFSIEAAQVTEKFIANMQMMSQKIQYYVQTANKETTEDLIELLKTIVTEIKSNETSLFVEINQLIKNMPKEAILFTENTNGIHPIIQEVIKLTNSIVHTFQVSIGDENTVFYVASADDENVNTDINIPFDYPIRKKVDMTLKMLKDCNNMFLDSPNLDKNISKLLLSYGSIVENIKACQGTLNCESELAQNYPERLEGYQATIDANRSEFAVSRAKEFILVIKDKQKEYPRALAAFESLVQPFEELTQKLRDCNLIDENNSVTGTVSFELTNPILKGKYTIPAQELKGLADHYSLYLNRLNSFQKICARLNLDLSKLIYNPISK